MRMIQMIAVTFLFSTGQSELPPPAPAKKIEVKKATQYLRAYRPDTKAEVQYSQGAAQYSLLLAELYGDLTGQATFSADDVMNSNLEQAKKYHYLEAYIALEPLLQNEFLAIGKDGATPHVAQILKKFLPRVQNQILYAESKKEEDYFQNQLHYLLPMKTCILYELGQKQEAKKLFKMFWDDSIADGQRWQSICSYDIEAILRKLMTPAEFKTLKQRKPSLQN